MTQEGLGTSTLSRHVVMVGSGMSGLVTTKPLQDAGHQVSFPRSSFNLLASGCLPVMGKGKEGVRLE